MRRALLYAAMTKDGAQRSIRTFYVAVILDLNGDYVKVRRISRLSVTESINQGKLAVLSPLSDNGRLRR
jgi:hypothetical protein